MARGPGRAGVRASDSGWLFAAGLGLVELRADEPALRDCAHHRFGQRGAVRSREWRPGNGCRLSPAHHPGVLLSTGAIAVRSDPRRLATRTIPTGVEPLPAGLTRFQFPLNRWSAPMNRRHFIRTGLAVAPALTLAGRLFAAPAGTPR